MWLFVTLMAVGNFVGAWTGCRLAMGQTIWPW